MSRSVVSSVCLIDQYCPAGQNTWMSDDEISHEEIVAAMTAAFFSPEIQACMAGIRGIAHFDISPERAAPFLRFHAFITKPQPKFITEWRENPKREHWYHTLTNGVLGNVRSALSAVEYHHENLRRLEEQLSGFLETVDYKKVVGNSTMGLGGTAKLDFEYQAYVVSYRRCLDYLTRALSAYFGSQSHSFRRMDRGLQNARPSSVADALLAVHQKYQEPFRFVLGVDGDLSVRDRIAHHEAVSAGCFNLSQLGVCLAGGGEKMRGWASAGQTLADVLAARTETLHQCIEEMLDAFIASAGEVEASRTF